MQLGDELEVFGKAHVMSVANGHSLPRFSKYSGVAPWANGYFLWINIDIDSTTGKSKSTSEYTNTFLDSGERVTWFGGSTMHPESPVVVGLLKAGASDSKDILTHSLTHNTDTSATHTDTIPNTTTTTCTHNDDTTECPSSVVMFVREVKSPYCCFGRVALDSADLTRRPVHMTWRLLDYHTHLKHNENFKRIVDLVSSS